MKVDLSQVTSYLQLLNGLPSDQADLVKKDLLDYYLWEIEQLKRNSERAKKPKVILRPFRLTGTQFIAEFEVKDLAISETNAYNWHGQNTSQWVYAGCICVQDGVVSAHH